MAGAVVLGQFEERLKECVRDIEQGNVILFLDKFVQARLRFHDSSFELLF
jgi:ATP-dependent Clp protease ATP-binding subunit ClpA